MIPLAFHGFRNDSPAAFRTGVAMFFLCMLALPACTEPPSTSPTPSQSASPRQQSQAEDHFSKALGFLEDFDRGDRQSVQARIHYHLNQWAIEQKKPQDWSPDPLLGQLPSRYQNYLTGETIGQMQFLGGFYYDDVYYMQQAYMMHTVADWVAGGELHDPTLEAWFEEIAAQHGDDYAQRLTGAWLLFDWTIRNIQLDAAPTAADVERLRAQHAEQAQSESGGTAQDATDQESPEVQARRLAGASYGAWEGLQLGHGDALTRAHIFSQLAWQWGGLDVVLVARPAREGPPIPWATALLLEGELYLFDTELGLPIPGAGERGIATLNQVLDDPALLRQLDLPDMPYPVTAEDLQPLNMLVIASPAAMALRMEMVEKSLPPGHRLRLSYSPSTLAAELRRHRGVSDVMLWIGPYEHISRSNLYSSLNEHTISRLSELEPYMAYTPLSAARGMHLRGEFVSTPVEQGAKELYLACRPADSELLDLNVRAVAEERLRQTQRMPVDESEREAAIREEMRAVGHNFRLMTRMKRDATYWLGLVAYEDEDFETAAFFFSEGVLADSPPSPWVQGATYNLGRTYEVLGTEGDQTELLEEARQLLEYPDTPQLHGNLIRARRIEAEVAEISAPEATESPAAEEEAVPAEAEPSSTP